MGDKYIDMIEKHADVVGQCVEENIYDRHLKRLFNLWPLAPKGELRYFRFIILNDKSVYNKFINTNNSYSPLGDGGYKNQFKSTLTPL